ncbi:Acetate--CoA ligase [ADP-forming] I [uncultured archaeon]|nr:Acetate--CoA ligase [ADP-forming] I [uncultured archaeon]
MLSLKGLDKIFSPKTVAVFGASNKPGSVGHALMANLLGQGFDGIIYPINPKRESVQGVHTYASITDVPRQVDLAVIATPAVTVPAVLEECGKAGVKAAIVISSGFKESGEEGKKREEEVAKIIKKYQMRLIGPNCLGVINTRLKLNASFAIKAPLEGNIAFISQSGAICSSVIDWAESQGIGFSYLVSVGSMLDVDFGDLIDYFGYDQKTQSILVYMESITDAKKFMSAASGFARQKPIVIVKAGRYEEGRKAILSHTGAMAGFDDVYSAAFKRAGVVRVREIEDLFDISQKIAMGSLPKTPEIAVITNAGGPGVMATDKIIESGGKIAPLEYATIAELNGKLPQNWSHGNPIDVLGDAGPNEYGAAVTAALNDKNVGSVVVILTPQSGTNPTEIAQKITEVCANSTKPITASFMGGKAVEAATEILRKNKIPSYHTPENAVKPLLLGYEYVHNLELLHEAPEELSSGPNPDKTKIEKTFNEHYATGQLVLSERESKEILSEYGIKTTPMEIAKTKAEAVKAAEEIGYPVVLKIESPDITHKTDAGGVMLSLLSAHDVEEAYDKILLNAKGYNPNARITGITVSKMMSTRTGFEVLLGAKRDDVFGEVIVFGAGGTLVEVLKDTGIGLPPLTQTLAKRIMEETKSYKLLKNGARDRRPANIKELEKAVVNFSQLIVDNSEISEVDINPLLATPDQVIALDARIILAKDCSIHSPSHLCITPYPTELIEKWVTKTGEYVTLRPIKPEDEFRVKELFNSLSPETIRHRFFRPIKEMTHEMLIRYCHNDYDREIAIVSEKDGKLLGVSRIVLDPGGDVAEFSVVVTDAWQNKGLGTKLVTKIIEIAKTKSIESIYANALKDNRVMVHLAQKLGFSVEKSDAADDYTLRLKLR